MQSAKEDSVLNYYVYGETTDQPDLLIAHGLFGSARNWRAIAKRLSAKRRVIVVDMRNHGDSFWDKGHEYPDMGGDLRDVISEIGGPMDVMGHSMGGKAAMVLALAHGALVNRLIVVDIAPEPYSHSQMSNVEIMQGLPISKFDTRGAADEFLAKSLSDQMLRAFLLQSLVFDDSGNYWKLNLPALASNMDAIIGFPEIAGKFTGPTLFIRGSASDYVHDKYLPRIKTLFPNSEVSTINGAGHWVHAEAQRAFVEAVITYLGD